MFNRRPELNFESTENRLLDVIVTAALVESVRAKLFDYTVVDTGKADLVRRTGFSARAMGKLLDLIEELGLLERRGEVYKNTHLADEFLVSSSPFYQGDILDMHYRMNQSVSEKMGTLLVAENGSEHYREKHKLNGGFLRAMAQYSKRGDLQDTVELVTSLPGFGEWEIMCDIGGNHCTYSMEILKQNPAMVAVVADLPPVVSLIEENSEEFIDNRRVSLKGFDVARDNLALDTFDLILASHVLHVCSAELEEVIRRIGASLKSGGWFVVQGMGEKRGKDAVYGKAKEFVTGLMGYETHFLKPERVIKAMKNAGLENIIEIGCIEGKSSYIVAAEKP